ncbi:MAG TPA: DNA mismatch repair protein MutS [Methylocella sp.]|nr:DNA mismatch repair protein MutS [Methylocella sp.]
MMAQYGAIKAEHAEFLLFYRMGDFYELFFDDAEVAARALNIVLTKRGKHDGEDIPMCGVPVERADDYLHRLISQGHRVAICEQVEDPAEARKRGAKSVVRREVVRLVTPGTLTEDLLLDPGRANCFLTIAAGASEQALAPAGFGIACVDISTGAFSLIGTGGEDIEAEIARLDPAEIVVLESLLTHPVVARLTHDKKWPVTPLGGAMGGESARHSIKQYFGLATLAGLGPLSEAEISAAAAAIRYIERTQMAAKPALSLPSRLSRGTRMEIDAATRANLELTRAQAGTRAGSLLAAIDRTSASPGSRLLAERLATPLASPEEIARRLDAVAFFVNEPRLRRDIRASLKTMPDISRALSRLAVDRGGPRDLACLREGLETAQAIAARLSEPEFLPDELAAAAKAASEVDAALAARLRQALAENLPLGRRDGGFVRAGYDRPLDDLRALRDESRSVVATLQARYGSLTGIKNLKLKHNHFLGYFIEVPQAQGEWLLKPPHDAAFVHRQTMAGAMRFSTKELAELDAKIASAAGDALIREQAIFDELATLLLNNRVALRNLAAALAVIDVSAALAELAESLNWTRPKVDRSLCFGIEGGRHPVVEAALRSQGQYFAPNACKLSGLPGKGGRIAIITGPNMAGKSTYLRQNALIAILAQMGSFVPAEHAHIGIVDKLYSRVGAADDLARGRSTFMVEMIETAAILNQAGEHSLVILDEIGRGTATFDGLSIAWAVIEHLHDINRSRALFATHFHELTQLAEKLPRLDNLTVRVSDWNGEVVFLHEIMAGAADRSYGIQVAKLAGLPAPVLNRGRALLAEFEAAERISNAKRSVADLPLFAPQSPAPPACPNDPLRAFVDSIDPDALSPRAALEAIYELKNLAAKKF